MSAALTHSEARTTDVDASRAEVARLFCDHRLAPAGGRRPFEMSLRADAAGPVAIVELDYGCPVHIEPEPLRTFYLIQIPQRGRARISQGGREIVSDPATASVLSPGSGASMTWGEDNPQLLVHLERGAVESALAARLGPRAQPGPLTVDLAMDLRTPPARAWLRLLRYVQGELADDAPPFAGEGASAQGARHLLDALVDGFLVAHRHSHSDALRAPAAGPIPHGTVARALAHMEEHLGEPLTVAQVAAAAGVSERSLQAAFRRELGTSPLAALQERRLALARARLRLGSPESTTVTQVATSVGWPHLGRFAGEYRRRFGEPPGRTLQS